MSLHTYAAFRRATGHRTRNSGTQAQSCGGSNNGAERMGRFVRCED
jgi:hypothetical protein